MDCEYKPNDIVPIAVGVALACLVVAVLVAYMVGRRRNRQNGYQSVWVSSKVLNAAKIDQDASEITDLRYIQECDGNFLFKEAPLTVFKIPSRASLSEM